MVDLDFIKYYFVDLQEIQSLTLQPASMGFHVPHYVGSPQDGIYSVLSLHYLRGRLWFFIHGILNCTYNVGYLIEQIES